LKKREKMTKNAYPQKAVEWRSAIQNGIGLRGFEGQKAYAATPLLYEKLEQ
jgi:hypothetical protein